MATVSKFDDESGVTARKHANDFITRVAKTYSDQRGKLLEIGPQDRSAIRAAFTNYSIESFDIVDTYKPTHVGDLTKKNLSILDGTYDCVAGMEVLEHTTNPFRAVKEMRRILKHEGILLVSAPLNYRIHGPMPDCWRFTEHGFKVLLKDFDIIEIDILETPGRDLFPIHYNVLAKCNKFKNMHDSDINFRFIN